MALTGKKLAFAKAKNAGNSHCAAAEIAGYSPATAAQAGSRLAKDPDVKAYLEALKKTPAKPRKPAPASVGPDLPEEDLFEHTDDPRIFLKAAMNNAALDPRQRIGAAIGLMPYEHTKLGEGGKKDQKDSAAKVAAKGKFAPSRAPGLRAVK